MRNRRTTKKILRRLRRNHWLYFQTRGFHVLEEVLEEVMSQ